jgi:hypothetical protein
VTDVCLVEDDGAPRGSKSFVLWNPPLTTHQTGANKVGCLHSHTHTYTHDEWLVFFISILASFHYLASLRCHSLVVRAGRSVDQAQTSEELAMRAPRLGWQH